MKLKTIIITIITILILSLTGIGIYSYFFAEDKDSTLTMAEKQWIEDNKNNVIDLGIVNDIPIFNYNGEGVFFDFITSIEESTNLEFNKLSYNIKSDIPTDYSFSVVDEIKENDLLVYQDNYAILSNVEIKYNDLNQIEQSTIGVLQNDIDNVTYYLGSNNNITFKSYNGVDELLLALTPDKTGSSAVNAIILPKTIYLADVFKNNLQINYNVTEMTKNIVLTLGKTKKLNDIITKYYEKWKNDNYEESYNQHFTNYYLELNSVADDAKVKFKSKQYKYGFIDYAPYDTMINGKLTGLNSEILASFAKTAGIEIKYQSEYKSAEELTNAFNTNAIDLYFDSFSKDKFDIDIANTVSTFDEDIVVLAKQNTNFIVNSISSLKNYNIMTLKNSKISSELKDNKIEFKDYNNINDLLSNLNDDYLLVIDKVTYETYKLTNLNDYEEIYNYKSNENYSYIIRDIKDNKVLIKFFNFYLSFINEKEFYNKIDYTIFKQAKNNNGLLYSILGLIIIGTITIIAMLSHKNKPNNKKIVSVGKENKLKYIDLLTSLKNRNYLNDNIEKWDESGIYPQTIVIVDLNNVAYINDNYGHTEGDNVIKEAANILFKNQVENSEIMRTNGNEFLIYLVEYDEKQVISYIRKLSKELKDLSHGFGAAVGYSMITDGLKTIDDAINEATLDMRSNKEEANN